LRKVSQVLATRLQMSRQTLIRLKRSGEVFKNGNPVYLKDLVRTGDILTVKLVEEKTQDISPEFVPLDIIYEDEHLVAVNKKAGIVVHPTKGYMTGTLAHGLLHYYRAKDEDTLVRPIHRLDRDTSGLVLFAKNPHVQGVLTAQHRSGLWQKRYLAVVEGMLEGDSGRIEAPILRLGGGKRERIVSPTGQEAVTLWEKLAEGHGITIVKATLVTGRTHQVRVHFAHIGHPLVGDELYGRLSPLIGRQALHAAWIEFDHPVTHHRISLYAPPPGEFADLLFLNG